MNDTPADIPANFIGPVHLTAAVIHRRVAEMGADIACDYHDADLLLVSVLKGAVVFVADLARAIDLPLELDFMAITSYQQDSGSSDHPAIRLLKDLDPQVPPQRGEQGKRCRGIGGVHVVRHLREEADRRDAGRRGRQLQHGEQRRRDAQQALGPLPNTLGQ